MSRARAASAAILLLIVLFLLLPWAAEAATKGEEEMQKGLKLYAGKEYSAAAEHFSKASAMLEKEKKILPAADAAYNQGLCLRGAADGRDSDAMSAFDRSAALYAKGKDETKAANALLQGAQAAFAMSRLSDSEKRYDEARGKGARLKSDLLHGLSLEGLGKVAFRRGRVSDSRRFYLDSLDALRAAPSARARVALQLVATLRKYGDMPGALDQLDRVEAELAPLEGDEKTRNLAGLLRFLVLAERGHTLLQLGFFDRAEEQLKAALELEPDNPLITEGNRLSVQMNGLVAEGELGNPAYAAEEVEALRRLLEGRGLRDQVCAALVTRGRLLRVDGKYTEAMACFEEAVGLAQEAGLEGRMVQAVLARANLLHFQGSWKASESSYRLAFNGAVEQGDMESALVSLMGVERIASANHLGLSGKVDYRRMQGIPWRGALLQPAGLPPSRGGDALAMAWRRLGELSREWFSASVPGLRGTAAVESAAAMLSWRRIEGMARHLSAEGVLRLATGRRDIFLQVAEALRSLGSERGRAADEGVFRAAFEACWSALRLAAGRGLLGDAGAPVEIQVDGFRLVPEGPVEKRAGGTAVPAETQRMLTLLAEGLNSLSLKDKEQREVIGALLRGERMPPLAASGLTRAAEARAAERARRMEGLLLAGGEKREAALKEYAADIFSLLESLGGSPLDEIRGQDKLARYVKGIESESRQEREARAADLALSTPPYTVYALDGALALSEVAGAWGGLSLRTALLRELGVLGEQKGMNLRQGIDLLSKSLARGSEAFDKRFSLSGDESPAELEKKIEGMLSIAEGLVRTELLERYEACREMAETPEGSIGFDDRQAMRELMARYLLALGEPEKARETAESVRGGYSYAARTAGGMPNPELMWRTLSTSARAALALGDDEGALPFIDQAIEVMESISPSDGTGSQATTDKLELYRAGIETAFRLYEGTPSRENAERLWRYLEGMKSRQWREMLATTGGAFLDRLPGKEAEGYGALRIKAAQLLLRINFLGFRGLAGEADEAVAELQEVRRKMAKIAADHTVDAADGVPTLEEVSSAIHPDWIVADYYLSPALSFAFVLERGAEPRIARLPLDYDGFFAYNLWMRTAPDLEYQAVRANEAVMVAGMTSPRLAEQLFSPVAELTGGKKRLLIIPHDLLYTFPYETMSVERDGRFQFLLDDGWTFAELPSAFLLTARRDTAASGGRRLVVIADPEYYPAVKKKLGADEARRRLLEGVDNPYLRRIRDAFCKYISPLGNARREGETVAGIWKGFGEARLLAGADASERMLYDPKIAAWEARNVHVVCHGYDRNTIPDLQPGLALSPVEDTENDSFAQMGELSALRWRSDLVVLSACDTGLGDLFIGDGMVGLNTVFLAGGAKGMLISRWRVPDDSAPDFMALAYSRIAAGDSPADALASAKKELKRTFEEASNWAVFKYAGIPW